MGIPRQFLRSATANKRPLPGAMVDGQLAMNTADASPGLFFKNSLGDLVKVGPVHVGTTAPNATPASGGQAGNSVGEQWLDTTGGGYKFKIWDGTAWRSEDGEFVNASGDVMTGALGIIAGTATDPGLYVSGDTNTGIYSPGADQLAVATNGVERVKFGTSEVVFNDGGTNYDFRIEGDTNADLFFVDASTERVGIGTNAPDSQLSIRSNFTDTGLSIGSGGLPYNLDVNFLTFDNSTNGRIRYNPSSAFMSFWTNQNERLRITSAGLVGIGSSAPNARLQVNAPSGGRSYSSSVLDFSNIHLEGSSTTAATSALTFTSSGAGGAAIGFSRGAGFDTSISFWTNPGSGSTNAATQRMTIDSAGRVGIGTTSPSELLHLTANTNPTILLTDNQTANTNGSLSFRNGTYRFDTQFNGGNGVFIFAANNASTEYARFDTSGRLLVGTSTSPTGVEGSTAPLVVQGQIGNTGLGAYLSLQRGEAASSITDGEGLGNIIFADNAGNTFARISGMADGTAGAGDYPGRLVFSTTADGASSPTERMRIKNNGFVGIGTTSPAYLLEVAGSMGAYGYQSRSGTSGPFQGNVFNIQWNGSVPRLWIDATDLGTISVSSDYRIKKDIKSIASNCIDRIKQLRPVQYQLNDYGSLFKADGVVREGFIAHEVQEVIPSGAEGEKDEENRIQNLRTDAIVAVLTKALQEAIAKIETLEAKVAALESA